MSDVNNFFFFSPEMLMKFCENDKELWLCPNSCLLVLSFAFQYENSWNCKIIRDLFIFTLLFFCFNDKSNWEIKLALYKLCMLKCIFGIILPGNGSLKIHTHSVDSRCFKKKLMNMFLSDFAMHTWGASGYKPVGEILFLFVIPFCCKVA